MLLNPNFEEKFLNKEVQKIYFNTKHVHTFKKNHDSKKNHAASKKCPPKKFFKPKIVKSICFQEMLLNPNFEEKFLNKEAQKIHFNTKDLLQHKTRTYLQEKSCCLQEMSFKKIL